MFRNRLKSYIGAIVAGLASLIFSACASTPTTVTTPSWLLDKNAAFPSKTYISALGEGDSNSIAISEASAGVARYFRSEIQTHTTATTHAISGATTTTVEKQLDTQIDLSSSVTLSGIEYTPPFYEKKNKKWYCVAFLEREKAWNQFLPTIEKYKADFYAFYNQAQGEGDALLKYSFYRKALVKGEDFLSSLDMGRVIHQGKEAAFVNDRETVHTIPSLLEEQKSNLTVFIALSGDYSNFIKTAVTDALSQNHLKVAKTEKDAYYRAEVCIENNESGSEPIALLPSVDFKLVGKNGKTVFVQQIQADKKSLGYTLESAQKKAYPALAEKLADSISIDLKSIMIEK